MERVRPSGESMKSGGLTGEFFEPMGGVAFGVVGWGEGGDDGVDGVEEAWMGLRIGEGLGDAGETDAGASELSGALGDATGALAHEGLAVEGAFAGEDEVGVADPVIETGCPGEDLETGIDPGIEEGGQGESESTGCAGTGSRGGIAA